MSLMLVHHNIFETPSNINKIYLINKLVNINKKVSKNVVDYHNEFTSITSRLELEGLLVADELQTLLLMSSLLDSWESLDITVDNSSDSEAFKTSDLASSIFREETHMKNIGEAIKYET